MQFALSHLSCGMITEPSLHILNDPLFPAKCPWQKPFDQYHRPNTPFSCNTYQYMALATTTTSYCQPVSGISGRRHLRSADRGHLDLWNLLRTEDVNLHTPALQIGTHFLLTLETTVFLFHLLRASSKHFSSLSTRLAHAARLGFFLQKRAI